MRTVCVGAIGRVEDENEKENEDEDGRRKSMVYMSPHRLAQAGTRWGGGSFIVHSPRSTVHSPRSTVHGRKADLGCGESRYFS